jgi:hypothetical protein
MHPAARRAVLLWVLGAASLDWLNTAAAQGAYGSGNNAGIGFGSPMASDRSFRQDRPPNDGPRYWRHSYGFYGFRSYGRGYYRYHRRRYH